MGSGNIKSSDIGDPVSIESCIALAAASSISKLEIVLSSVLQQEKKISKVKHVFCRKDMDKEAYWTALCVFETSRIISLESLLTSF